MSRPFVTLKFACSIDGCLDDTTPVRRIFSGPEDRQAVYALRRESDAILIGAGTLRTDRPKLTLDTEAGKSPARIILTGSGNIPADAPLFSQGSGARIIYVPVNNEAKLRRLALPAEIRGLGAERVELELLLKDLSKRGMKSLLVEGGAKLLSEFLSAGLFDRLRVAVSPEVVADKNAPRVFPLKPPELKLRRACPLGGLTILEYDRV